MQRHVEALRSLLKRLQVGGVRENNDYYEATVSELRVVAGKMSRLVGRDTPWTWRYIRNILNENIEPSTEFRVALAKMIVGTVEGESWSLTASETQEVRVIGDVKEGAIVYGDSRLCRRPSCGVWFVPYTWNMVYCCEQCRVEDYKRD